MIKYKTHILCTYFNKSLFHSSSHKLGYSSFVKISNQPKFKNGHNSFYPTIKFQSSSKQILSTFENDFRQIELNQSKIDEQFLNNLINFEEILIINKHLNSIKILKNKINFFLKLYHGNLLNYHKNLYKLHTKKVVGVKNFIQIQQNFILLYEDKIQYYTNHHSKELFWLAINKLRERNFSNKSQLAGGCSGGLASSPFSS